MPRRVITVLALSVTAVAATPLLTPAAAFADTTASVSTHTLVADGEGATTPAIPTVGLQVIPFACTATASGPGLVFMAIDDCEIMANESNLTGGSAEGVTAPDGVSVAKFTGVATALSNTLYVCWHATATFRAFLSPDKLLVPGETRISSGCRSVPL